MGGSLQPMLRSSKASLSLSLSRFHSITISGLFCGLLIVHAIMASMATKFIARLQHFFIFLNIAYVLWLASVLIYPSLKFLITPAVYLWSLSQFFQRPHLRSYTTPLRTHSATSRMVTPQTPLVVPLTMTDPSSFHAYRIGVAEWICVYLEFLGSCLDSRWISFRIVIGDKTLTPILHSGVRHKRAHQRGSAECSSGCAFRYIVSHDLKFRSWMEYVPLCVLDLLD